MKKRILAMLLGLTLAVTALSGCGNNSTEEILTPETPMNTEESEAPTSTEENGGTFTEEKPVVTPTTAVNTGTTEFNNNLIAFVEANGFENQNYMISPTSYRAALALATAGADGETKEQLLKAMGFASIEEMNDWYTALTNSESTFELNNSIWKNTISSGDLNKEYIKYVEKIYGATAKNVKPEKMTKEVDKWINEKTHGLIPTLGTDMSKMNLALVNTLYLKSGWTNEFEETATKEDTFHTFDGKSVTKEFMHNQHNYRYYEDEKGKFIVMPMDGGINAVFILGDVEDVVGKMKDLSYQSVSVFLPKFENETSFNQKELIHFLQSQGAELAFTADADFSIMSKEMSMYISDIVQKTKIKVNEDGIEAAAATAVMMVESAYFEPEDPIEFKADEPFKYMLLTDDYDNPELLFYGQVVE